MPLNEYSSQFLAVLVREFPDAARRFTSTKETGCFAVSIPAGRSGELHVSTQEFGRIRVASDRHDVHFGGWIHSDHDQVFLDAMSYIRACAGQP